MSKLQKKQNTAGGGLYIALAICILSVICIGVYSSIINIFTPSAPMDEVENIEENKNPSVIVDPPKTSDPFSESITPPPEVNVGGNDSEETPDQNVNVQPDPPTYTMPVAGDVMKPFSNDILVYSQTMNDYRVHNGVDLTCAVGTPVKAFTDGIVSQIYEDPLMGQTIVIDHGENTKSIYQNLSAEFPSNIAVGTEVSEGQVIAGVGETILIECAEEPHLHFEVMVGENHVDPMTYFQ